MQGCKHLYSSPTPSYLNDRGAEYVVQTIKHFFDRYIVVQYSIQNTLEEQILSDVKLKVSGVDSAYNLSLHKAVHLEASAKIKYNDRAYVYAVLSKLECEHPFPQARI